jgi:RHS repeat-associated protein
LLDDVRFSQLLGTFFARIYDETTWLVTASLGENGQTMRYLYDGLQNKIATIGPSENVVDFSSVYFSRNGNNGVFLPADPNSQLTIKARNGGVYDDFRDGQWQDLWQANNPNAWAVHDGTLIHTPGPAGSQPDTITLRGSDSYLNYGVRVEVIGPGSSGPALTETLGINIGGKVSVQWTPQGGGTWQLYDNVEGKTVQSVSGNLAREWVVLAVNNSALFYADGDQLFAYTFQMKVSGALEIFTGTQNRVAYKWVLVFNAPQIRIDYKNGGGLSKQTQALKGTGIIVSGTLFDDQARPAVQTRATELTNTLPGFSAGFVTAFDWTTGLMQGQAADFNLPDQGYPYARTLYENSPQGREVEKGAPGKDFAFDLRTPVADRHTIRYQYAANSQNGFMNSLPAGQYYQKSTTDQDGVPSIELTDQLKSLIAKGTVMSGSGPSAVYLKSSVDRDAAENPAIQRPPNYYAPPSGSNPTNWITTSSFDIFGRVTSVSTTDSGLTQYIYDDGGRKRFVLDANGATQNPNLVQYCKYDILGRPLELGYILQNWNRAQLQDLANTDPAWPPTPATWQKELAYDGDGTNPNLIGRLCRTRVNNGAGTQPVVETFDYDLRGNFTTTKLQVPDFDNDTYTCRYAYDNLNNVAVITYPQQAGSGGESPQIFYGYDDLGLVNSIGDSFGPPGRYASAEYYATGTIKRMSFNNAGSPVTRDFAYNPPGSPTQLNDRYSDEALNYITGGYQGASYYNGNLAQRIDTAKWKTPAVQCANEFQYDNSRRLTVADYTNSGCALNTIEQFAYDGNGNFASASGNIPQHYTYYAGTNKVRNTDGGTGDSYVYDANGNVIQASPKNIASISYDPCSQRTLSIRASGPNPAEVNFEYGSKAQRVVKTVSVEGAAQVKKLYVHSVTGYSLVERTSAGELSIYIHGLGGLVAMRKNSSLYFVVRDFLGSTRVVFDESNKVVSSYDYTVFGDFMGSPSGNAAIINYLYTGQEFDRETGLYNYQARIYDTSLRRFISPDPASDFGSPYIYAYNNPLLFVDPTGEFPALLLAIIIGAIIGALAGGLSGVVSIAATGATGGKAAGIFFANFFTGLAVGALTPLLPEGGALLGAAFGARLGLQAGGTAATILTGTATAAASVAGGTVLGTIQGAITNAAAGSDANEGARVGAITGFVGGVLSELGGFLGGKAVASYGDRIASRLLQADEAVVPLALKKATAVANVVTGLIGGGIGAIVQGTMSDAPPGEIAANFFIGFLYAVPGLTPLVGGPGNLAGKAWTDVLARQNAAESLIL